MCWEELVGVYFMGIGEPGLSQKLKLVNPHVAKMIPVQNSQGSRQIIYSVS